MNLNNTKFGEFAEIAKMIHPVSKGFEWSVILTEPCRRTHYIEMAVYFRAYDEKGNSTSVSKIKNSPYIRVWLYKCVDTIEFFENENEFTPTPISKETLITIENYLKSIGVDTSCV